MNVAGAIILGRIEVMEGIIVIGTKCDGHCFAYLEPASGDEQGEPILPVTGMA